MTPVVPFEPDVLVILDLLVAGRHGSPQALLQGATLCSSLCLLKRVKSQLDGRSQLASVDIKILFMFSKRRRMGLIESDRYNQTDKDFISLRMYGRTFEKLSTMEECDHYNIDYSLETNKLCLFLVWFLVPKERLAKVSMNVSYISQ